MRAQLCGGCVVVLALALQSTQSQSTLKSELVPERALAGQRDTGRRKRSPRRRWSRGDGEPCDGANAGTHARWQCGAVLELDASSQCHLGTIRHNAAHHTGRPDVQAKLAGRSAETLRWPLRLWHQRRHNFPLTTGGPLATCGQRDGAVSSYPIASFSFSARALRCETAAFAV